MIMLVTLLLLTVVTVPLAGGRLHRLDDPGLRHTWLLLLALLLQLSITTFWQVPPTPAGVIHVGSYVLAGGWVVANLRIPGMGLVAGGGGANAAAIVANGGVMPARPAALELAGLQHDVGAFENSAAVDGARLWFLGDVFAVPEGFPLANVFSVGDVALVLGGLLLLHRAAGSRWTGGGLSDARSEPAPAAA